jgi:hypothetical protein
MSQYAVRVQMVLWFEIVVDASSLEEAIAKAENLPPHQICTKGKKLKTETGLADPDSAKLVRPDRATAKPTKMSRTKAVPNETQPTAFTPKLSA